jgi:hypothetical protein
MLLEMTESRWDVYGLAMTNTCVTFTTRIAGIPAPDGPTAAAKAIAMALEKGLKVSLMLGSPPLPVSVICFCPYQIDPAQSRVEIAQNMPGGKLT